MELVNHTVINLITFVLMVYANYHVAWAIMSALRVPLMVVMNAILAIVIVSAMLTVGLMQAGPGRTIGVVVVALAAVSIFNGSLITQRILEMFKKGEPKAKGGHNEGAKQ